MIPEDWTQDDLDSLADELPEQALSYLGQAAENERYQKLKDRIDSQVPDQRAVLAQMTADGYYSQEVEVRSGLTAQIRALGSGFQDDCIEFASQRAESDLMYRRLLSKRKLAYSVLEINGKQVGPAPVRGSLFDLRRNCPDGEDPPSVLIRKNAEERYEELDLHSEIIVTTLSEAYRAWESALQDRLSGDTAEALGKSTGTPDNV